MKKIQILILSFLVLTLSAYAVDKDYKNNLLKVDVQKVQGDSYKVTLYTQSPYNEPLKVISKSDTEYYLLLPETYHSITSTPSGGAEGIKNVDVKLYPYLGEDLNNGYTRVNISTSKPVKFYTDVRTAQTSNSQRTAQARLERVINQPQEQPRQIERPRVQQIQVKPIETPKVAQAPKQIKDTIRNNIRQFNFEPQKPLIGKRAENSTDYLPPVKGLDRKINSYINDFKNEEPQKLDFNINDKVAPFEPQALEDNKEATTTSNSEEETLELPQGLESEANAADEAQNSGFRLSKKIKVAVGLFIALLIFFALGKSRKRRPLNSRLASQPQPVEDEALIPMPQQNETENQGQYYSPFNDNENQFQEINVAKEFENEQEQYEREIVQAQIQLEGENDEIKKEDEAIKAALIEETKEEAKRIQEEKAKEPTVLASAQIEEGKSLYLIDYDSTIALVGIIGENFFIIKQFNKIDTPQIQYRLSEKRDNANYYIVRVDTFKALVKVSSDEISLKIEL